MARAGQCDLTPLENSGAWHNTNHRPTVKSGWTTLFFAEHEDTHTVELCAAQTAESGLLDAENVAKEVFYRTPASGAELRETYPRGAQHCLIDRMGRTDIKGDDLREIAARCGAISVEYEIQAQSCGGPSLLNARCQGWLARGPVR